MGFMFLVRDQEVGGEYWTRAKNKNWERLDVASADSKAFGPRKIYAGIAKRKTKWPQNSTGTTLCPYRAFLESP